MATGSPGTIYNAGSSISNSIWNTTTFGGSSVSTVCWYSGYSNFSNSPISNFPIQMFSYVYNNINNYTNCTLYYACDDNGFVYVNNIPYNPSGTQLWGTNISGITVNLTSGNNTFLFYVYQYASDNVANPSGFVAYCTNGGNVLFSTSFPSIGWNVYLPGNFDYPSRYTYKNIKLENMIMISNDFNNSNFYNNTQGFNFLPGSISAVSATESLINSISSVSDNNYGYTLTGTTKVLANRMAYYDNYTSGTGTINIPTGVNYIRAVVIGAVGGGGGGAGSFGTSYAGGGGGSGGLFTSAVFNYIIPGSSYTYTIGNAGSGGAAGVSSTTYASVTSGTAGNSANNTTLNIGGITISINGSGGGGGGIKPNSTANGPGGAIATNATLAITGTTTYTQYSPLSYPGGDVGSTASTTAGANGGWIRTSYINDMLTTLKVNSTTLTNHIVGINYQNDISTGGIGGPKSNFLNANAGKNGVNGVVRIYYFYN
jgi:hypothetical protein